MSRVGKQPIKVPSGVKIDMKGTEIRVEGPKGKLSHKIPEGVLAKLENGILTISADKAVPKSGALHGLSRTLISNMVSGVTTGFTRELEISGIGYRAQAKGNVLTLNLGYSHPIDFKLPDGIQVKVDGNTKVTLTGADKMLVGMVAAKIRSFKKPDPYQAKGVKYAGEVVIRKAGKAAASGGAK